MSSSEDIVRQQLSWAGLTLTVIDDITWARPAITKLESPKFELAFRAYPTIVQN